MSQSCPSCRGADFEEIGDQLYCATPGCGIRIGGQKTVAEDVFLGTEIRLTQEVKSASAKPSARKESGAPWTTYEAFNLIIIKQLDFLINECGAPQRLKQVVFALWATFLTKSEVAFVDDSEETSKLPFTSRQRDIVLIAKGMKSVPEFKSVKPTVKLRRSERLRLGNKIAVRQRIAADSDSDSDATVIMDIENTNTSNTLSNSSDLIIAASSEPMSHAVQADVGAGDVISADAGNAVKPQVEIDEDEEDGDAIDKKGRKKKARKVVRRIPKAAKPLPSCLQEHEMNSLSQEGCKPFMGMKRSRYRHRPEYIDYMDLRTTLAFIFIACRFINHDIQVTDLIRWVDQGFLVYFASTRLFPEDWFLKARDHHTFCPNSSPFPQAILNRASKLLQYLEVPPLPPIDVFKLIERFLDEMNLPIDILHVIKSQARVADLVCEFGECRTSKKLIFRFFELHAMAIIIITLRKMFGSGLEIKTICDEVRKLPGCDNCFCFDEWIEAAKLRVLALRRYYLPLFGNCESDITDPRVVVDFHAQVVRNGRFLANNVSRDDPTADANLSRLFGKLESRSDPPIEFPGPSMRCLNEASDFVKTRIDQKPFLQNVLSLSFRSKTLDYVAPKSMFANIPYELVTPRGSQKWDTILDQLPTEMGLLLQLASWLLHMSPVQLLPEIKKVEKLMFPEHYPKTRTAKGKPHSVKKRRHAEHE